MRHLLLSFLISILVATPAAGAQQAARAEDSVTSRVRRELEDAYRKNIQAFQSKHIEAVNALRAPDYHTVGADGATRDRDAMTQYTIGLFNGVKEWISTTMDIDSLHVEGDLAIAIVRQHWVRRALRPDAQVHHIETWVTQRETWRKAATGWLLFRVDNLRDQKRLVDGKPE
jgi:hypothetical protein